MCFSNMGSFFNPPPSDFHYIQYHYPRDDGSSVFESARPPVRVWFHPGQEQLRGYNTWYVFRYAARPAGFGVHLMFLRMEEWWGRYHRPQRYTLDSPV